MRRALRAMVVGVSVAVTVGLTGVQAQDLSAREYQLKAAFLFNFVRFVDWPPTHADLGSLSPWALCVLGPETVAGAFGSLDGRWVRGREVSTRHLLPNEETSGCNVLFIAGSRNAGLIDRSTELRDEPLLTVGESSGFLNAGGIIAFVYRKNELRFEVDLDAASRAGIAIRSELLELAMNVRGAGPTNR